MAVSEETRNKIKKAHLGKELSDSTKKKMRLAHSESAKKVSIESTVYPSLAEASRQLGIKENALRYRLKSMSKKFSEWYYLSDDRDLGKAKPVSIDNCYYPSINMARKFLKISSTALLYRLSSDKYPEYKYVS